MAMRPIGPFERPSSDVLIRLGLSLAGLFAALVVGLGIAVNPRIGGALAAAALFGPIALLHLPVAIAGWTSTLFIQLIPGISLASNFAGIMIAFIWFGTVAARRETVQTAFQAIRTPTIVIALFFVWLGVTLGWSDGGGFGTDDLIGYAQAILLFAIIATTMDTVDRFRLLAGAFVVGAVLSILLGLITQDLTASAGNAVARGASEGRLTAGGSDPNDLAAALIPAVALAVGLLPSVRGPKRFALLVSIPILLSGLVATQSRGGLLAAIAGMLVAIAVARGHRFHAVLLTLGVVAVVGFGLATTPGALDRVSSADNGGNGRTELWTVAVRMWEDHPFVGVGLGAFRENSDRYVREPGTLRFVDLIVEKPHVVHNTYLQLLSETGLIGLVLFLAVAAACLAAAWRANGLFVAAGRPDMAVMAQAVMVALVARLAAMVFLSVGSDYRTWLVFALGPALLGIAIKLQPQPQPAVLRRGEG